MSVDTAGTSHRINPHFFTKEHYLQKIMVPTFSDCQISLTFTVFFSVFCLMNLTNTFQLKLREKNITKTG